MLRPYVSKSLAKQIPRVLIPKNRFSSFQKCCSKLNINSATLFQDVGNKWSKKWDEVKNNGSSIYEHNTKPPSTAELSQENDERKKKFYALSMFPYPSGMLHLGHVRVYTISDVLSRFRRMQGYDVINPMGWDAFGLPAENAAIERGIDPKIWTVSNIEKMKQQMNLMFADFDWEYELRTCSPDYYKWTQKIFLLLHKEGLAYRKEAEINWDPIDKTVLANEQVDDQGRSWRSGAIVEKKMLEQWFLGITKFAKSLNDDLSILKQWPDKVKTMQSNWIGQSFGTDIKFPLSIENNRGKNLQFIETFTTRPDTLFGVQYMALALDHPIVKEFSKNDEELKSFIKSSEKSSTAIGNLPDFSKEGYQLKNIYISNPLTPDKFDIPVFVAPYVIGGYGHAAVMGCPGHDQRDFEFWSNNMPGSPIIKVIDPLNPEDATEADQPYFSKVGKLASNCGKYVGLTCKEGGKAIIEDLEKTTDLAKQTVQYRIRDWLISRQRYWGAPIPMVYCDDCGVVPVPDDQLPVLLPEDIHMKGKSSGNPLASCDEFVNTTCPECHGPAKRDTDTMDTFMDSSWYFLRYTDSKNNTKPFSYDSASSTMPVDIYIGGVEHAILHLLYSRFISKFLASINLWDGGDLKGEPFKRLVTQGMVHGRTYSDPDTGRFLKPDEIELDSIDNIVYTKTTPRKEAKVSYEKMSKSKYNGADPEECITKYGPDSVRAHMLFQAPINDILNWDEIKIVGVQRWFRRFLTIAEDLTDFMESCSSEQLKLITKKQIFEEDKMNKNELKLSNELQLKIKSITNSFDKTLSLNTVISDYMKLTKTIYDFIKNNGLNSSSSLVSTSLIYKAYVDLILLIAPVAPSIAEEAWSAILKAQNVKWKSVFTQSWPIIENPIPSKNKKYKVFINGKFKFEISIPSDIQNQDKIIEKVLETNDGKKYISKNILKSFISKSAISFILK